MQYPKKGDLCALFLLAGLFAAHAGAVPIAISSVLTKETCTTGYDCTNGNVSGGRTYLGLQKEVTTIYADLGSGLQGFVPRTELIPKVTVVRAGTVNPGRTVIWQARRTSDNKFYGVDPSLLSTEDLYARNDLYLAGDNTFVNDGTVSSSNIERIDFALPTPVFINGTRYTSVLDRGPQAAHDGFGIAAILSVDGTGKATSWGNLLRVAPGWANGPGFTLSSGVGTVFTREANSSTLTAGSNITGQVIAGLLIPYTDLVPTGTRIYGYSVVAYDVNPAVYTSTTLADVTNNLIFPKNTPQANSGLDLPVLNFGSIDQVPEPGTWLLFGTALALAPVLRKRG